jgi:hypothetical protein
MPLTRRLGEYTADKHSTERFTKCSLNPPFNTADRQARS